MSINFKKRENIVLQPLLLYPVDSQLTSTALCKSSARNNYVYKRLLLSELAAAEQARYSLLRFHDCHGSRDTLHHRFLQRSDAGEREEREEREEKEERDLKREREV